MNRRITIASCAACLGLAGLLAPASPAQAADGPLSLRPGELAAADPMPANALAQTTPEPAPAPEPEVVTQEEVTEGEVEEPGLPLSIAVSYYLLSDYVYRGVNFSEYAGEGREKPNHQLTTSISWDFGDYGTLGFDTFFEWYAAQKKLNPVAGGQNLQEADYNIWYEKTIDAICTTARVGFLFYTFPNSAKLFRTDRSHGNNNNDRTQEWWVKLSHNDAWMWCWLFPDNKEGVLNPTFFFAQDVGVGAGAVWLEFGISHTFRIPGIDNLTITPGFLVAVDGGYTKRVLQRSNHGDMRLAYQQLSLNTTYDLTPVLCLPKWAGTLSVSGLLYYQNALGNSRDDGSLNDEFYGGMAVNWGWGG